MGENTLAYALHLRMTTPPQQPIWTRETTVQAGLVWVEEEGSFIQADLRLANGLPSWEHIKKLWGTMGTYRAAIRQAQVALGGTKTPPQVEGPVRCPRCDTRWTSPDKYNLHVGARCKGRDDTFSHGDWLNGPVIMNGDTLTLEDLP